MCMNGKHQTWVIALTGGIGSGKSVVARILTTLGYSVYDCDSRARFIMDTDPHVGESITGLFGEGFVDGGVINRKKLADLVFSDSGALDSLNKLVHGLVRNDFTNWVISRPCGRPVFVETAILYQSGFDRLVDEVWNVIAPERVRIERVMKRNGLTEEQVKARINSQDSFCIRKPHPIEKEIVNDGVLPLLPQIENLLQV